MEDLGSDAEENYSDAEDTHQSPATSPEERRDDESQNQLSALVEEISSIWDANVLAKIITLRLRINERL